MAILDGRIANAWHFRVRNRKSKGFMPPWQEVYHAAKWQNFMALEPSLGSSQNAAEALISIKT